MTRIALAAAALTAFATPTFAQSALETAAKIFSQSSDMANDSAVYSQLSNGQTMAIMQGDNGFLVLFGGEDMLNETPTMLNSTDGMVVEGALGIVQSIFDEQDGL